MGGRGGGWVDRATYILSFSQFEVHDGYIEERKATGELEADPLAAVWEEGHEDVKGKRQNNHVIGYDF